MTLITLIIGLLLGYIIGCIILIVGFTLYDTITSNSKGSHMIRASEVQRIREELLKEFEKK